jgi:methionine-R-sulfoxide reductase
MAREADLTEEQWRERLTPSQYEVLRRAGTEPPGTGEYVYNKVDGSYRCAGCGDTLFSSATKFESGTGWPSFTEPETAAAVELKSDVSHGMARTEVRCRNCGGHLGHVFPDGPAEAGGLRYCINSASLRFIPLDDLEREGYGAYRKLFDDNGSAS